MECLDPQQLEEYLGGVSAETHKEWRAHLEACESCRALATQVAENVRVAEKLQRLDPMVSEGEPKPDYIGKYRVLDELNRGGMGVVYLAEQDEPRRRVALKVIKSERASPRMLRRFKYEVEILGRLEHPGSARIYEAGIANTKQGSRPFFAMELVDGSPITDYVKRYDVPVPDRLNLLAELCDAVQHAHQKGVIHRDLKPANIYVNGMGEPKILDFGVARSTDPDMQYATRSTSAGKLIGTILYMSPEQARGASRELDTRSDVYSLGVVAYQVLSSRLPYETSDKTLPEVVRMICEDDVKPLSAVNRRFRGDLDAIILKALEKSPDRRYQSAADFGRDLKRYLHKEPIAARRPTLLYQFGTRVRRHPAICFSVVVVALAIASLVVSSWRQDRRVAEERRIRLAAFENSTRAYRMYEEAVDFVRRGERDHARSLLDRATGIYPDFAIAFLERAKLRLPPRYLLRDPASEPAVRAAVEDCIRAHDAAGGNAVVDPATGQRLTQEELDARGSDKHGFLNGLPTVRRIKHGRYERIGEDGAGERVGGPGFPRALLEAGFMLLTAGEIDGSVRMFERAAAAGVDDLYARIALAGFLTLRYQRREALDLLQDLTKDPQARNIEKVWTFLGFLHLRQAVAPGETANPFFNGFEAARAWREAIRINPGDPRYYVNLGVALRDIGGDEEALATYRKAVEIDPKLAVGWSNIGVMLRERKRNREAIEAFSRAIELQPEVPWYRAALARLHARSGDCVQAVAAAEELVSLSPGDLASSEVLFEVHRTCKNNREALAVAEATVRAMPHLGWAWVDLGSVLLEENRLEEAKAAFVQCLSTGADLSGLLGLAAVERERGRGEAALKKLLRAARAYPRDPEVPLEQAKLLLAMDRDEEAAEVVRRTLDLNLGNPSRWVRLGKGLDALGMHRFALEAYERGGEAFEDSHEIAIERLRLLLTCQDQSVRDAGRALEAAELLVKRMRNHAEPAEFHALALLRNERYRDALKALDRLERLCGADPRYSLWRCVANAHLGDWTLAGLSYYQARSLLEPRTSLAEEVADCLAEAESLLRLRREILEVDSETPEKVRPRE